MGELHNFPKLGGRLYRAIIERKGALTIEELSKEIALGKSCVNRILKVGAKIELSPVTINKIDAWNQAFVDLNKKDAPISRKAGNAPVKIPEALRKLVAQDLAVKSIIGLSKEIGVSQVTVHAMFHDSDRLYRAPTLDKVATFYTDKRKDAVSEAPLPAPTVSVKQLGHRKTPTYPKLGLHLARAVLAEHDRCGNNRALTTKTIGISASVLRAVLNSPPSKVTMWKSTALRISNWYTMLSPAKKVSLQRRIAQGRGVAAATTAPPAPGAIEAPAKADAAPPPILPQISVADTARAAYRSAAGDVNPYPEYRPGTPADQKLTLVADGFTVEGDVASVAALINALKGS